MPMPTATEPSFPKEAIDKTIAYVEDSERYWATSVYSSIRHNNSHESHERVDKALAFRELRARLELLTHGLMSPPPEEQAQHPMLAPTGPALANSPYDEFTHLEPLHNQGAKFAGRPGTPARKRGVDDAEVTGHDDLIPTTISRAEYAKRTRLAEPDSKPTVSKLCSS